MSLPESKLTTIMQAIARAAMVLAVTLPAVIAEGVSKGDSNVGGTLFAMGKIGPESQPYFLGSSGTMFDGVEVGHAEFLESTYEQFRMASAGPTAAGVIMESPDQGMIQRFDDATRLTRFNVNSRVVEPENTTWGWCQVCKGVIHTVASTCDGRAYTWGGFSTVLYDDEMKYVYKNYDPSMPILPEPLNLPSRVIDLSCGENHTLILTEERKVYSMGQTTYNRLGLPENKTVEKNWVFYAQEIADLSNGTLPNGDTVCHVVAGGKSSFAITDSGETYVWGANEFGQLGMGQLSHDVATPTKLENPSMDPKFKACDIAAGKEFAVATDQQGDMWTWGAGFSTPKRFGLADSTSGFFALLDKRIVQVAAGEFHVAFLTDEGDVITYGYNRFGQLGVVLPEPENPPEEDTDFEPESPIWTLTPRLVEYLKGSNIKSIFADGNYTLALSNVPSPLNCGCAKGGRKAVNFEHPNLDPPPRFKVPVHETVKQPKLPETDRNHLKPNCGNKKKAEIKILPGEVDDTAEAKFMNQTRFVDMGDSESTPEKKNLAELPKAVPQSHYYPAGSPELKALSGDGIERTETDRLFGMDINENGEFYGDKDSEVDAAAYRRERIMSGNDKGMMPESKGKPFHSLVGTPENEGLKAVVPSLGMEILRKKKYGDKTMRTLSAEITAKDLEDKYAPVDFSFGVVAHDANDAAWDGGSN